MNRMGQWDDRKPRKPGPCLIRFTARKLHNLGDPSAIVLALILRMHSRSDND